MDRHPFAVARRVAALADAALVFFSCGKDSQAALDVCCRFFRRVEAVYMYVTPGLSFHEATIRRAEKRYGANGLKVHRLPHWALTKLLRTASFRDPTALTVNLPALTYKDVEAHARELTGIEWVAGGQKACDSLERRGLITRCGGVDEPRKRFYPLAWWKAAFVPRYLKERRIPLSADYAVLGGSYDGNLDASMLVPIRRHWPGDYERIAARFPHVRAEVMRHERSGEWGRRDGWGRWDEQSADYAEWRGRNPGAEPLPEVREGSGGALADDVPPGQPAGD